LGSNLTTCGPPCDASSFEFADPIYVRFHVHPQPHWGKQSKTFAFSTGRISAIFERLPGANISPIGDLTLSLLVQIKENDHNTRDIRVLSIPNIWQGAKGAEVLATTPRFGTGFSCTTRHQSCSVAFRTRIQNICSRRTPMNFVQSCQHWKNTCFARKA